MRTHLGVSQMHPCYTSRVTRSLDVMTTVTLEGNDLSIDPDQCVCEEPVWICLTNAKLCPKTQHYIPHCIQLLSIAYEEKNLSVQERIM
jgi:hypothetical protein